MRLFVSLTVAAVLVLATTAAQALTQEEILKRRLEKMSSVDSQLRTEDQQRQDQIREATANVGSGPSKQADEPLVMPSPVRQPHPEPKGGLFDQKAPTGPKASTPATAGTPPNSAPPVMPPVAKQPAPQPTESPTAQSTPQPVMQSAPQPVAASPMASPPGAGKTGARDPNTATSLAAMAAKAQAAGDNQTALTMLDEAIAADPGDPDLRNNRGNILSNLGKPKEALGDYDRAIAAKTSDPAFFTNRGLAHERLGNRERACADYKKACDLGECDFFKSYKAEGNCR